MPKKGSSKKTEKKKEEKVEEKKVQEKIEEVEKVEEVKEVEKVEEVIEKESDALKEFEKILKSKKEWAPIYSEVKKNNYFEEKKKFFNWAKSRKIPGYPK